MSCQVTPSQPHAHSRLCSLEEASDEHSEPVKHCLQPVMCINMAHSSPCCRARCIVAQGSSCSANGLLRMSRSSLQPMHHGLVHAAWLVPSSPPPACSHVALQCLRAVVPISTLSSCCSVQPDAAVSPGAPQMQPSLKA